MYTCIIHISVCGVSCYMSCEVSSSLFFQISQLSLQLNSPFSFWYGIFITSLQDIWSCPKHPLRHSAHNSLNNTFNFVKIVIFLWWIWGFIFILVFPCHEVWQSYSVKTWAIALKNISTCLARVAQWTEHRPMYQQVAGSIPGQGICLGCGLNLW